MVNVWDCLKVNWPKTRRIFNCNGLSGVAHQSLICFSWISHGILKDLPILPWVSHGSLGPWKCLRVLYVCKPWNTHWCVPNPLWITNPPSLFVGSLLNSFNGRALQAFPATFQDFWPCPPHCLWSPLLGWWQGPCDDCQTPQVPLIHWQIVSEHGAAITTQQL